MCLQLRFRLLAFKVLFNDSQLDLLLICYLLYIWFALCSKFIVHMCLRYLYIYDLVFTD